MLHHCQGSQCTIRLLMRLFRHKWTFFFMSPKESHIFRKQYFSPDISIFYFSNGRGKMTAGIQLSPTGEEKESGQYKYYSTRLDRWKNKKKEKISLLKRPLKIHGQANHSHRCNSTAPRRALINRSWLQAHTRAAS